MQRASGAFTAAACTAAAASATAAALPSHPLAGALNSTQSEASDVEELYGPLPPFKGPKVARSHSETAAPPLPDRQPGQQLPPPEELPTQPPKQQRPPPPAAPPKPQPQPQAKPQPQASKPPPRQQPPPKPAPASSGAKAGAGVPPPAGNFKFRPGQCTFSYEELKGMRAESGIDMARKEDYLSDSEFRRVFRMDCHAFQKLKRWRQLEVKKDAGLF